jgi:hypothetical protein
MHRHSYVVIAGAWLLVALCGMSGAEASSPACTPVAQGTSRLLLDGVPSLIDAQMTPTRDGGVVVTFSSYRGSPEFPGSRFTVLALDAAGCTRWRVSLPGGWPLARPVVPDAHSIVVGAVTTTRGGAGNLALTTLSAASGRVLRADVLGSVPVVTGIAPTLLADRRGDVTALLASDVPTGRPGHSEHATLKLTRRSGATRWTTTVLARSNSAAPAAAAMPDGRLAVGYPRRGRYWVRTGTIAGSLGAPIEAGPVTANYRRSDVAIGGDGAVAAVWESMTYSRPWRLRAAVLPSSRRRFAPVAVLGADPGRRGTLLISPAAAVHVQAGGGVTIGFGTPSDGQRIMCVTATPAGHFAAPREVGATTQDPSADVPGMLFGPTGTPRSVLFGFTPAEDAIVNSVATLYRDCRVQGVGALPVDRTTGAVVAASVGPSNRVWLLGQDQPSVDSRRPLRLTIAG